VSSGLIRVPDWVEEEKECRIRRLLREVVWRRSNVALLLLVRIMK